MSVTINSAALVGVEGVPVTIEVDVDRDGLDSIAVHGLDVAAGRETVVRVKSAIENSGYVVPRGLIVINVEGLPPRCDATRLDLPISLGILEASGQMSPQPWHLFLVLGELGLSGAVRAVRGVLPMALDVCRTKVVCPNANVAEAVAAKSRHAGFEDSEAVIPIATLAEAAAVFDGSLPQRSALALPVKPAPPSTIDLAHLKGNRTARRALEIAAAGGHSILLAGPPGTGKTLLARCLAGILPPMTTDEQIDVSRVYSAAGQLPAGGPMAQRPFRAPHHTASAAAISGGGNPVRPGEVSLASGGVLFLDEIPEFDRGVREALREPMATGKVTLSRAGDPTILPARFQLVATANPCPCGYFGVHEAPKACKCDPAVVERYQARIPKGFDLVATCLPVPRALLLSDTPEEGSAAVKARVVAARERAMSRQGKLNGDLSDLDIATAIHHDDRIGMMVSDIRTTGGQLDNVTIFAALRVARTIADLEGCTAVERRHVAEALCFRGGAR